MESLEADTEAKTNRQIRLAKFWLLAVGAAAGWIVLLAKLWTLDLGRVALSTESVTSLLLAVFAIGLSAAFYFRADKVSSDHYTRTYEFTERVAELLSRLEVGVVGQLASLTRTQAALEQGLRDSAARSFSGGVPPPSDGEDASPRMPSSTTPRGTSELAGDDDEIATFAARLGSLEDEYAQARRAGDVEDLLSHDLVGTTEALPSDFVGDLWREVVPALGGAEELQLAAPAVLESRFGRAASTLDPDLLRVARDYALVDESYQLTSWGLLALRRLAEDGPTG